MSVIEKNLNVQNGSVLKTFQILDCFTLEQPIQRIGDLCKKTGMNRSTIFRFMNSLNEIGIVVKGIDGSFKLGIKLFELGYFIISLNKYRKNKSNVQTLVIGRFL